MKKTKLNFPNLRFALLSLFVFITVVSASLSIFSQEKPPAPSNQRNIKIPLVQEKKLSNGLTVVVVERKNLPLVTAQLMVKNGAGVEDAKFAGLADTTATMLTKGTKTRTATQIAEELEFLGANMNANANWNSSQIVVNMTSDKTDSALSIMADMVLNPLFAQDEIDLYKKQTLDELIVRLKQPNNLASYVASRYSYGEHPALGTPESLNQLNQTNIEKYYKDFYFPKGAVLIFTGDISALRAFSLANKYFGKWNNVGTTKLTRLEINKSMVTKNLINRLLVVDLPNSGQAAVTYAKQIHFGRLADKKKYFSALVSNTVLGGGYSARLNYEIRIKRGLSYGAGSSITWRNDESNFLARAQTKNVSAAEVAELVVSEVSKLVSENGLTDELTARKLTLNGDFGRDLASTDGLAERVGELYLFGLKTDELSSYMKNVQIVSDNQIKDFASNNLKGGDLIIVGDYSVFKADLAKRFPNMKIDVIKADELDLSKDNLRK